MVTSRKTALRLLVERRVRLHPSFSLPLLLLQFSTLWLVSGSFLINLGGFNGNNMRCSPGMGSSGILQISPSADVPPHLSAGRCLYNESIKLLDSTGTRVSSFSTTFTFSLYNAVAQSDLDGSSTLVGFAFIMVAEARPEIGYDTTVPKPCCLEPLRFLGVLNDTSNGKNSSHTFAIEYSVYDSRLDQMFNNPPYDHVGINVNNMNSSFLAKAGSYNNITCDGDSTQMSNFVPMNLSDGRLIQTWNEYEGRSKQLNVSLSHNLGLKPSAPLLVKTVDLTSIVQDTMYIGFSCAGNANGRKLPSFIYAWSFNPNGSAPPLYPEVPPVCGARTLPSTYNRTSIFSFILDLVVFLSVIFFIGCYLTKQKQDLRKEFQLLELENLEFGPLNYTYQALRTSTASFDTNHILGSDEFGTIYKGVLGISGREVAVKRIFLRKASQRDFIAEVKTLGRLRHRNLVQLQGWCCHEEELLLVYEFLPFCNLDLVLCKDDTTVPWSQRMRILQGVAAALVYLHEESEEQVIHGQVMASNVMVDSEHDARLGNFGLARLYEHEQASGRTAVGLLAPEAAQSANFTEKTDIYNFGVLTFQVVSGRRPLEAMQPPDEGVLVEWIWGLHNQTRILDAVDRRLGRDWPREEILTVLQVGLLCSHADPEARPSMRRVEQFLTEESPFRSLSAVTLASATFELDDLTMATHTPPEISLIDSPDVGLIASFRDSMGYRASVRVSVGSQSQTCGI